MRFILYCENWERSEAPRSLLHLLSKFELAGLSACGPVVVRVDVCFVTAHKNGEE
jgi:hypothetical protein